MSRLFLLPLACLTLALGFNTAKADDITRQQHLDGIKSYFDDLVKKALSQTAPGDPLPPYKDQPPPLPTWPFLPKAQEAIANSLPSLDLGEDLFQLYGINNFPQSLSGAPLDQQYWNDHFSTYCANQATIETNSFTNCDPRKTNIPLQHADLKPSTLLGTDKYADNTASLAAIHFIRSVTDPTASKNIISLVNDKSEDGQAKLIAALQRQARVNIPLYSMLGSYAKRIPDPNNPDNKTFMEILDNDATRRYSDPNWHTALASSTISTEALLKDIAVMLSNSLWIQKEQYKQNERIELLLGLNALLNIRGQDKLDESQASATEASKSAQKAATSN